MRAPLARLASRIALAAALVAVLATPLAAPSAQDWGATATISSTMGVTDGRVCTGEGSRADLGCAANAPYVSRTTGAVGIGTATPTALLHVSGTLRISTGGESCDTARLGAIKYESGNLQVCRNTSNGWEALNIGSTTNDRIISGTSSVIANNNTSITLATAGVERVIIGTNGNVGIAQQPVAGSVLSVSGNTVIRGKLDLAERDPSGTLSRILIGNNTGNLNTGRYVIGIGFDAASSNTGNNVIALGDYAASSNTGSSDVTAIGNSAASYSTGSNIIAIGWFTARDNTGSQVTALGNRAAFENTGNNVVAIGYGAAQQNTGSHTIALGLSAARNNTANETVAIGQYSLMRNRAEGSVGIGSGSLSSNGDGIANTGVGYYSLASNDDGSLNTALGYRSGYAGYRTTGTEFSANTLLGSYTGTAITTGSSNTIVGANSGMTLTTGSNNILIGAGITPLAITGSGQLSIGNAIFGNIGSGAGLANLIGINVTSPSAHLQVSGTVSATRFVGDGSGLTNLSVNGDRVTSGTTAAIVNSATSIISLSTTGTTWGYLSSAASYLPNLSSNLISTTGISVTGTVSATNLNTGMLVLNAVTGTAGVSLSSPGDNLGNHTATQNLDMGGFNITNAGTISGTFVGDGSGLTNLSVSGDRITSSTTSAVIANQSGGTVSFTLGSTPGAAYLHPTLGLVGPGVSTTGTVSAVTLSGGKLVLAGVTGGAGVSLSTSGADNLGNHTATQALNMSGYNINNVGTISGTFVGDGSGLTNLPGGGSSGPSNRISTTGVASGATLGAAVADKGTISFTLAGVAGAAYLHGTLGFVGPAVNLSTDGTAAAPAYSWITDTNTGMYRVGADQIGISTASTQRALFSSAGLTVTDLNATNISTTTYSASNLGTAATPNFKWDADPNTGLYLIGADTIGITTGGSEVVRFAPNNVSATNISVTNLAPNRVLATPDSVSAPTYTWANDLNTGMYWVGSDQIGISTGSTQRALFSSAGLTVTDLNVTNLSTAVYSASTLGTATTPSFKWDADPNTGIYLIGADTIGITTGGSEVVRFAPNNVSATNISGSNITANRFLATPDSVSAPTYTWANDLNTGMYWVGADQIGISTGSTQRALFSSAGLTVTDLNVTNLSTAVYSASTLGSAAAPSFKWDGDTNTGFYLIGADTLGVSTAGTEVARFGTNNISATNVSATNLGVNRVLATPDSVSAPTYTWANDLNTGMYWVGSDQIGISTGSTQRALFSSAGLTVTNLNATTVSTSSLDAQSFSAYTNGTITTPSFGWNSDPNTGLYWVSADQLGITAGGVQRALVNTTGLVVTGIISNTGVINAGAAIYGYQGDTAAAPGYSWSGDPNTGLYWIGADAFGLTTGGTDRFRITTTNISTTLSILGNAADTAALPGYSWNDDTNTGMFHPGADVIGFSAGGTERVRITANGISTTGTVTATAFAGDGSRLTNLSNEATATDRISTSAVASGVNLGAVVADKGTVSFTLAGTAGRAYMHTTLGFVGPGVSTTVGGIQSFGNIHSNDADTAASPGYAWSNNVTTGMFSAGLGVLGLTTAGTERFRLSSTSISLTVPIFGNSGDSASYPGYSWSDDGNTGMYHPTADIIGFTADGVERMRIGGGAISSTSPFVSTNMDGFRIAGATYGSFFRNDGANFYLLFTGSGTPNGTFSALRPITVSMASGMVSMSNGLTVTGTLSATAFVGDGSGLTGIGGASDRISTTAVAAGATLGAVVADKGTVSFTLAGTAGRAYMHTTLGFVGPAVSTTVGNVLSYRNLNSIAGDAASAPAYSWSGDDDTGMFRQGNDTLSFATAGVERMRILSTGQVSTTSGIFWSAVGIGKAPDTQLDVSGSMRLSNTGGAATLEINRNSGRTGNIYFQTANLYRWQLGVNDSAESSGNAGSDFAINAYNDAGSFVSTPLMIKRSNGYIGINNQYNPTAALDVSGSINYSGTLTDTSDRRLKTKIAPLPFASATQKLSQLAAVQYEMKSAPGVTEYGFIAQDVESILPSLVHTAKDVSGTKSLNYIGLIPVLVQANQELAAENAKLKATQESILKRLEALEKR